MQIDVYKAFAPPSCLSESDGKAHRRIVHSCLFFLCVIFNFYQGSLGYGNYQRNQIAFHQNYGMFIWCPRIKEPIEEDKIVFLPFNGF